MHVAATIGIGVGLVAGAGLLLAACGPNEKDPQKTALDEYGKFDRAPKDNNWMSNEVTRGWTHTRDQEVNTFRLGDTIHGTKQRLQWESTESMRRVYDAAKGNDAVLSLQELKDFALTFDADKNGVLNRQERRAFTDAYGVVTTQTQPVVVASWPFSRDAPREYPRDPGYGSGTSPGDDRDYGGGTSPGDDFGRGGSGTSGGDDYGSGGGWGGGSGGNTSPGDGGWGGGSGGNTSPGDSGGTPPSSGGSGRGNSTDNGNPDESDF